MMWTPRTIHRILAVVLSVAWFGASIGGPQAAEVVSLRWALGMQEVEAGAPSGIQQDTELAAGSRLKFLVEPMSAGSVYLILLDSTDEISVLYRETIKGDTADPTYIPPDSHWFELDDRSGIETFFLLASVKPLAKLEQLLDRHAAEAGGEVVEQIVAEIRRVHKANRQLSRPVEKPVMIGGQTRGGPDGAASSIDRLAVEIQAEGFYGKTITLDH